MEFPYIAVLRFGGVLFIIFLRIFAIPVQFCDRITIVWCFLACVTAPLSSRRELKVF